MIRDNHRWCNDVTGHFDPHPHIFPDLLGMVPPGTFIGYKDFREKRDACRSQPLVKFATCVSCHAEGEQCRIPDCDMDSGGLPCIDYAMSGKRQKHEGSSGPLFVVWAKRHKRQKTKVVVLENAPVP